MSGAHAIGPLYDPITWYNITHAGEQVVLSGTSKTKAVLVDMYEFHCCGTSPTMQLAHQHVWFCTL